MTRSLDPAIIAFPHALQKGALVTLPTPTSPPDSSTPGQLLRFQYNPESITRTRTASWESRSVQYTKKGPAAGPGPGDREQQSSLQGGGLDTKPETISMKLVFDATELLLKGDTSAENANILPELAGLEMMMIPRAMIKGEVNAVAPPELLLVLGSRYFPVVITSMTITEKRFAPDLTPLRAEVDVTMQVLEPTYAAGDPTVQKAFEQLKEERVRRAKVATTNVAVADGTYTAISAALRVGRLSG